MRPCSLAWIGPFLFGSELEKCTKTFGFRLRQKAELFVRKSACGRTKAKFSAEPKTFRSAKRKGLQTGHEVAEKVFFQKNL
jgi:hypothetical protein